MISAPSAIGDGSCPMSAAAPQRRCRHDADAAPSTGYAIDVSGLHKSYGEAAVLEGIDLHVERGTVLALLGPNGAGKTTTVRIMSTLLPRTPARAAWTGTMSRANDTRCAS